MRGPIEASVCTGMDFVTIPMKRVLNFTGDRDMLKRMFEPDTVFNCCAVGDVFTLRTKYLSQPDFKVDAVDEHGTTCLMTALIFNQVEVAEVLLRAGADASRFCPGRMEYPLSYAMRHQMPDMVQLLLTHRADITVCDTILGGTLLHYASCFKHSSIGVMVKMLVAAGGDVNMPYKGFSPIYEAVYSHNFTVLQALLECGADPDREAADSDPDESEVSLDDSSEDVVETDFPLFLAVRTGNLEMVAVLLEGGANVNVKNEEEMCTALHLAAVYGRDDECGMVRYLLDKGADVNAVDHLGATPLADAAAHNFVKIMKLLVERGADVDRGTGWCATLSAAACNSVGAMRFLVDRGADLSVVSPQGYTPLSLAARTGGNAALVDLLLAAGALHKASKAQQAEWDRDMARKIYAMERFRPSVSYDINRLVIQ